MHTFYATMNPGMINREITKRLAMLAESFPVVAVTGPRQAGKTTLARRQFAGHRYFNLESNSTLRMAQADPDGFVNGCGRAVIDEVQRAPELLSSIQAAVDERGTNGNFVVSGSSNLLLSEKIGQSLAGRAAYAVLLPLSLSELGRAGKMEPDFASQVFKGFYPALYKSAVPVTEFYDQYVATFVERDVRLVRNIADLGAFRKFLMLLAGRIGQLLNLESLANDTGISRRTAEDWISVLEACFVVFRLQPWFNNFGKRVMKSPKIYFHDTGVACRLLGLASSSEVGSFYLRGGLFENMVIAEAMKHIANHGLAARLYFWRDSNGNEVDLLVDCGTRRVPVEIKSSSTFSAEFLKGMRGLRKTAEGHGVKLEEGAVVCDCEPFALSGCQLVNWRDLSPVFSRMNGFFTNEKK